MGGIAAGYSANYSVTLRFAIIISTLVSRRDALICAHYMREAQSTRATGIDTRGRGRHCGDGPPLRHQPQLVRRHPFLPC